MFVHFASMPASLHFVIQRLYVFITAICVAVGQAIAEAPSIPQQWKFDLAEAAGASLFMCRCMCLLQCTGIALLIRRNCLFYLTLLAAEESARACSHCAATGQHFTSMESMGFCHVERRRFYRTGYGGCTFSASTLHFQEGHGVLLRKAICGIERALRPCAIGACWDQLCFGRSQSVHADSMVDCDGNFAYAYMIMRCFGACGKFALFWI